VQNGGKDNNGFAGQFVENKQADHDRKGSGDSDNDAVAEQDAVDSKGETGRRFGNNSVEYFA